MRTSRRQAARRACPRAAAAGGDDALSSDPDDEPPPAAATGFKLNFNTLKRDAVDASKPVALKHTPREEVAAKAAAAAAGGDSDDLSSDPEDEVPAAKPTGFKLNFGGVKRDEVDASEAAALAGTRRARRGGKAGAGDDDDLSSDPEARPPAPKPTGFSLKLGAVKRDEVDASKPVAQSHTPARPRGEGEAKPRRRGGSRARAPSAGAARTAALARAHENGGAAPTALHRARRHHGRRRSSTLSPSTLANDGARAPLPDAAEARALRAAPSHASPSSPIVITGRVNPSLCTTRSTNRCRRTAKHPGTPRQLLRGWTFARRSARCFPSTIPELPLDSPQYPKARRASCSPPLPPPSRLPTSAPPSCPHLDGPSLTSALPAWRRCG